MGIWNTIEELKQLHKDDVKILKGIKEIEKDLTWLQCLENAGVDNWEGYYYAQELFEEESEDE